MRRHTALPLSILLAAGLAACADSPAAPAAPDHGAHAAHAAHAAPPAAARGAPVSRGSLFKAVRQQTSRFHSTEQAIRSGYAPDDHCVAHPDLGGMGYHWVNGPLVDPVFDPLQPEVLLYAPGTGDQPRLVGVEYVVIDVGQPHPHFDGHAFDVGGVPELIDAGVPHWSLHVWLFEKNPSGIFAPFNPAVSCD